jgi:hypothetical protein
MSSSRSGGCSIIEKSGRAGGSIEIDDEIEEVQVVLQEHVVAQRIDVGRLQRMRRQRLAGQRVGADEAQHLRAEMEVAQDQPVRLGAHERFHAPDDRAMQDPR